MAVNIVGKEKAREFEIVMEIKLEGETIRTEMAKSFNRQAWLLITLILPLYGLIIWNMLRH